MDHLPVRRTEKRRDRVDAGVFFLGGGGRVVDGGELGV